MKYCIDTVKIIGSVIFAFVFPFFDDKQIQLFCILLIVDLVTGVVVAYKNNKVSSKVYIRGVAKKIGILLLLSLYYPMEVTTGLNFKTYLLFILSFGEFISILENLGNMGVIQGGELIQHFKQIQYNKGGDKH